jgi:hypothetical protein
VGRNVSETNAGGRQYAANSRWRINYSTVAGRLFSVFVLVLILGKDAGCRMQDAGEGHRLREVQLRDGTKSRIQKRSVKTASQSWTAGTSWRRGEGYGTGVSVTGVTGERRAPRHDTGTWIRLQCCSYGLSPLPVPVGPFPSEGEASSL